METDRVMLLEYQKILEQFQECDHINEREIINAIDGLKRLIQHSEQDHILDCAIRTFCDFLFLASFFSEEDKLCFIKTLNEKDQAYRWDLNKNMIN